MMSRRQRYNRARHGWTGFQDRMMPGHATSGGARWDNWVHMGDIDARTLLGVEKAVIMRGHKELRSHLWPTWALVMRALTS